MPLGPTMIQRIWRQYVTAIAFSRSQILTEAIYTPESIFLLAYDDGAWKL
jgi:hypothetical protein